MCLAQAVVRSDGSGSTYVVSQFLATGSAYWPHGTFANIWVKWQTV
jgi:hypothetical protein